VEEQKVHPRTLREGLGVDRTAECNYAEAQVDVSLAIVKGRNKTQSQQFLDSSQVTISNLSFASNKRMTWVPCTPFWFNFFFLFIPGSDRKKKGKRKFKKYDYHY
jgi:hypothetical protein